MVRGLSIRRLIEIARRHAWEGAALLLFAVALAMGFGPVLSGAGKFAGALVPGMEAEASSPQMVAGARLALSGFSQSRYAPQILFPVTSKSMPLWMELRGGMELAPAPISTTGPGSATTLKISRPAIAICIDDLGQDLAATDKAMALPKDVAMSFLPYAETTPFLAEEALEKGHTVLAHVPMEALSRNDAGPTTLTVRAPDIAARIAWHIGRVPGLAGINNHEGSRFTEDAVSLEPVMRALAARHLFFFDSRTIADSRGVAVARQFGVMSAGRDIFLDDAVNEEAVRDQLVKLVAAARRNGVAIAIGHPHDVTLKVLGEWLARDHGVELVTLPEAMRRKSEELFAGGKRNGSADHFE